MTCAGMQHPLTCAGMQHPLTCAGMQLPLTCAGMQLPLTCSGIQHPLTCAGMQLPLTCVGMQHPLTCTAMQHPLTCAGTQHPLTCAETQHPHVDVCSTGAPRPLADARDMSSTDAASLSQQLSWWCTTRPVSTSTQRSPVRVRTHCVCDASRHVFQHRRLTAPWALFLQNWHFMCVDRPHPP